MPRYIAMVRTMPSVKSEVSMPFMAWKNALAVRLERMNAIQAAASLSVIFFVILNTTSVASEAKKVVSMNVAFIAHSKDGKIR
jgi:hypothetical protein